VTAVYEALPRQWPDSEWIARAARQAEQKLLHQPHGDLPRWRAALASLPRTATCAKLDCAAPELGAKAADPDALRSALMALHPWRKGPLQLGGVTIDAEWRSDRKWERIAPHVELRNCRVLDVGSGNGYYGLRMLAAGARLVVGVDPTVLFVMQWRACRHFSGDIPGFVLPLRAEELPEAPADFDAVFSMGVLYHRRDHLQHLRQLRALLRPGGTLVLETLVLPAGQEEGLLVPPGRYARMRNVWAVPGTSLLLQWLEEAGFRASRLVDESVTTAEEQRSTPWMRFESLEQALDPGDRARTVEGHPAPVRAVLIARN
jgi:tRNA (mo5U34)-methyltransferase